MAHSVYFSGIDLHKRTAVIHTLDAEGAVVKEAKLRNHPAAVAAYFSAPVGLHRAVVETTAGWYWMSRLLAELGVEMTLAHAADLKAICHAKVKTDRVDAAMLAQLMRVGMIPEAYQMEPEQRELRDLLRARLRLVQRRTRCKNSIERVFEKFNVEGGGTLPELYQMQVSAHRKQIDLLQNQIDAFERTLRQRLRRDLSLWRLGCVPGLGLINAATVLLETGPAIRFPTARQYFSYCRLVPGAQNSGTRSRHRSGHKAGNLYLKVAFHHAAVRAVQHYPEIRRVFQQKRRKKHPQIARAYIAKELARITYYMLRDENDFDGRFKGEALSRRKTPQWPRPACPAVQLDARSLPPG